MRTREEIMKALRAYDKYGGDAIKYVKQEVMIEVLLDIRELLEKKDEEG